MLDKVFHLFSVTGRAGRAEFWLTIGFVLAWIVLLQQVFEHYVYRPDMSGTTLAILGGALAFLLMVSILPVVAVCVRRLHDRDKSNSRNWLLSFVVAPFVVGVYAWMFAVQVRDSEVAVIASLLVVLVCLGLFLWAAVEMGFRKGKKGHNQFGPDPLVLAMSRECEGQEPSAGKSKGD